MPGRDYKKCANCNTISNETIRFPPSCGHVICSQCYPEDPVQRAAPLDRSKCPVCQQLLLFPNESPKRIFRTLRLFGYVRDCLLVNDPPQCRLCSDGQTKATAQCENCLLYLCRECADSHIKQGTLSDKHYVFTFQEIMSGRSKRSAKCETLCCDEGLEFTKFCESCETAFCDVCASEHQHLHAVNLEAGLKSCIMRYAENVEACAEEATGMQVRLKAEGERVKAEFKAKKRVIEEHAELLVARVLQERDEAVARLVEEFEVHEFHQKPLENCFNMSEAQISAIRTSIELINSIVEEDQTTTHLMNFLAFLKANTKVIDDIMEAIHSLNRATYNLTPYDVIINHDIQVMVQRAQIFAALPMETLESILDADTHIGSDNNPSHVVSMDTYSYKDGNSSIFVADEDNLKVKVFILREEEDGLKLRLHNANIAADKEPAAVFMDDVRDERNQLNDAICIHYTDSSDPGSYHKLDDVLQPFDNMKHLQTTLKFKSVGPGYCIDGKLNKAPHILNLSEQVAREGIQQGYFLLELLNTLRIELRFSRCVEGKLFALSGFHKPSNRSILMIGCRERPLKVLRFGHDTPGGVAIDSMCNIYYADPCNDRILTLTKSGEVFHNFVGFNKPIDICSLEMKQDQGPSEQAANSQRLEHDHRAESVDHEYMVVVERQGGLKAFDLRQIADRGQFP